MPLTGGRRALSHAQSRRRIIGGETWPPARASRRYRLEAIRAAGASRHVDAWRRRSFQAKGQWLCVGRFGVAAPAGASTPTRVLAGGGIAATSNPSSWCSSRARLEADGARPRLPRSSARRTPSHGYFTVRPLHAAHLRRHFTLARDRRTRSTRRSRSHRRPAVVMGPKSIGGHRPAAGSLSAGARRRHRLAALETGPSRRRPSAGPSASSRSRRCTCAGLGSAGGKGSGTRATAARPPPRR